ncbi:MAG TPA: hypothetical protein VH061_14600 [Solirubrobacteraceae bacterium]|nr:hypothetical protein [Solirubrobacteraceae bacterium]
MGERIVEQMGLKTSTDTLARWMAHRVAELIEQADESNEEAKREAASLILRLWARRSAWPQGWPPPKTSEVLRRLEPPEGPIRPSHPGISNPDTGNPWLSRITALSELESAERQVWVRLALRDSALEQEIALGQSEAPNLTDDELSLFRTLTFQSRQAAEHFRERLDNDTPLARAELAEDELSEIAERRIELFKSAVEDVVRASGETE